MDAPQARRYGWWMCHVRTPSHFGRRGPPSPPTISKVPLRNINPALHHNVLNFSLFLPFWSSTAEVDQLATSRRVFSRSGRPHFLPLRSQQYCRAVSGGISSPAVPGSISTLLTARAYVTARRNSFSRFVRHRYSNTGTTKSSQPFIHFGIFYPG